MGEPYDPVKHEAGSCDDGQCSNCKEPDEHECKKGLEHGCEVCDGEAEQQTCGCKTVINVLSATFGKEGIKSELKIDYCNKHKSVDELLVALKDTLILSDLKALEHAGITPPYTKEQIEWINGVAVIYFQFALDSFLAKSC